MQLCRKQNNFGGSSKIPLLLPVVKQFPVDISRVKVEEGQSLLQWYIYNFNILQFYRKFRPWCCFFAEALLFYEYIVCLNFTRFNYKMNLKYLLW